jgi:hypothetical protein
MPLNKQGIRRLADMLVANKKLYSQQTFGRQNECGTTCCLAGFCLLEEVGRRKFKTLIGKDDFAKDCTKAGRKLLGIRTSDPALFNSLDCWPEDLASEYWANGPRGRVTVALKALQRLLPSGRIDPDPKAVHTRLSQLKLLIKGKQI